MTSTTLPRSEIAGLSAINVGQGQPIVFLHGVGLRAEAWRAQIEAFCQTHNVIAPDMLGHGENPRPAASVTLQAYVQSILDLLEELPEPAIVVGHSMGAMIALELASQSPTKVRAVAALNAVFERSPEAAAAVQSRAAYLDGISVPDPSQTLTRWFDDVASPARAACETWLLGADPASYKTAYAAFARSDSPTRHSLRSITCPALFVTGALEPNSTPEMSLEMAALVAYGRALIVEGAAHMMPMTHPDKTNAALRELAHEVGT